MPVPIAVAELISLAIQSLIFGSFTVSHCITIWILFRGKLDRRSSRVNTALFTVSSLLWVLSAAHLGLTVQRALEAFVGHAEDTNRIAAFYSRLSDKKHVAQDSIYVTNVLINDSFLTYRLFVVWSRDWRVIVLPTLLLLGTAISGYGAVIYVANIPGEGSIFTALSLTRFLNALFTLPLATNLLLTCLIAGRIAWTRYETRKVTTYAPIGRSYWSIVDILVQSAAITACAFAALLGTYWAQSNAHVLIIEAIPPLIGFVFTLIVIRVYARNERESPGAVHVHAGARPSRGGDALVRGIGDNDCKIQSPVDVHLSPVQRHKILDSPLPP